MEPKEMAPKENQLVAGFLHGGAGLGAEFAHGAAVLGHIRGKSCSKGLHFA